jgi:beta-xylosidase
MPDDGSGDAQVRPQTSDDFSGGVLNPQWEWNHNPDDAHWSLTARPGWLRLIPMHADDLPGARDTLTQTMQDDSFEFTVRVDLSAMKDGARAGLAMFEKDASGLEIVETGGESRLSYFHLPDLDQGSIGTAIPRKVLQLRVDVAADIARYSYSLDEGGTFVPVGSVTNIHSSWWKGTRPALFAYTTSGEGQDAGAVDFDWVHYQPVGVNPW